MKRYLLALIITCSVSAQQTRSPEVLEVPQSFHGWAVIIWGIAGSRALPREGGKLVERLAGDGILITSTPLESGAAADELYLIDNSGNRVANPTKVGKDHGTAGFLGEPNHEIRFTEFFIGTPAEAKAVSAGSKLSEALSRLKP